MTERREEAAGELRARFAAHPASVPGARRFVADGLASWGRTSLVDDAALCVTELAANAALHSASTFMEVRVSTVPDAVRISVEDDGVTPADAVEPRLDFPGPDDDHELLLASEPTTGRGLAIVSILATDWGVDPTRGGKRIWAELTEDDDVHPVRRPRRAPTDSTETTSTEGLLPDGWHLVRLDGCPVELSLRQDQHLDELIRELQLIDDDSTSRALAAELSGLLSAPAHARHTGRLQAQRAAAQGLGELDIEMAMPDELSVEVVKLRDAVRAADVFCEERRLLTLASSEDLRELREWMTDQIVSQVDHAAAPVSWTEWRTSRP